MVVFIYSNLPDDGCLVTIEPLMVNQQRQVFLLVLLILLLFIAVFPFQLSGRKLCYVRG